MENILCEYGCGNSANHQFKNGKRCCEANQARCPASIKKKILSHKGYDYSLLSEEIKKKMSRKGSTLYTEEEIFVDGKEWGSEFLRKYIHFYKILEHKCQGENCGITEWKGEHLTLELDHINGKRTDNRKENLRWLCPNCHSQTPTFRGYNKTLTGKKKVSDAELLTALETCSNIRQALQSVGLAAKGGNYERASRLKEKCPGGEMVYTGDLE